MLALSRPLNGSPQSGWPRGLLGGFGIKTPDEFRRVFEVRKEHRDLLALACQETACQRWPETVLQRFS